MVEAAEALPEPAGRRHVVGGRTGEARAQAQQIGGDGGEGEPAGARDGGAQQMDATGQDGGEAQEMDAAIRDAFASGKGQRGGRPG